MHRFYISSQDISDKISILDKGEVHHIKDVLRLKAKDKVIVFDARGNEYMADIERLTSWGISLKLKEKRTPVTSKKFQITVACAIPKKSKMADIIDKLTQLGVDRIIPLKTSRVVIKLDKYKEARHQQRWEKIAQNASEQCQRNTLPLIDAIKDMQDVLSESGRFDLKLIPTLSGKRRSLKEVFTKSHPDNVLVFIGPEGDFTDEEIELARKSGCIPVSLGDLVLRVETAAVSTVSFMRLYENG
jgi:16S rRNA (uracil1498-N3)-methyltransferase